MTRELPIELRRIYPFRSHYLDVDGVRMHYVDEGAGPVVLLLHGNPTWSFYYRNLIVGLRDSFRVIAPDHVGCGLSDKPADYPYTLSKHVENLGRLANHLNLSEVTLGVHDWGGAIGFGWATANFKRVDRLVVFNSAAFLGGPVPWRLRASRWPVAGEAIVRGLNGFLRVSFFMACHDRTRLTPEVRRGYLFPYSSYADRTAILRFVRDIPLSPDHPAFDVVTRIQKSLPRLADRPMAIHWGARDFCFNDWYLNEWRRRFPRADVFRYADAGHYVVEDAHERIVPSLRAFLLKHSPRREGGGLIHTLEPNGGQGGSRVATAAQNCIRGPE